MQAGAMTQSELREAESTKKGDMWTREEDRRIMEGVGVHGLKWQLIAAELPGRSANAVRSHYHIAPVHKVSCALPLLP